jgi:hypothetical protein
LLNCADIGLIVLSSNFKISILFDVCPLIQMLFFVVISLFITVVTFLSFILAAILVLIIKLAFISILNFFAYVHASSAFFHQL